MKNTQVQFPKNYDARSFFSDTSLETEKNMVSHHSLVSSKQYKLASQMAESCGQDYYGAYLFNSIEARLKAIGDYLKSQTSSVQSIKPVYQDEIPENLFEGMIWLSEAMLDGIYIKGEPAKGLFLSIDPPPRGIMKKNDVWLNISEPDVYIDRSASKEFYQKEQPKDAVKYNVWISD